MMITAKTSTRESAQIRITRVSPADCCSKLAGPAAPFSSATENSVPMHFRSNCANMRVRSCHCRASMLLAASCTSSYCIRNATANGLELLALNTGRCTSADAFPSDHPAMPSSGLSAEILAAAECQ